MASSSGIACGDTKIVYPRGDHKATMVWLHDIGGNADNSVQFVRNLDFPNVKWICPTAPTRPVALLGGYQTTAWFDVEQISESMRDDLVSINSISAFVTNLLCDEPGNVMKGVGGMGMGAALALYFASSYAIGGIPNMSLNLIVGINGWLPAWRNFQHHVDSGSAVANLAGSLQILLINERSNVWVPLPVPIPLRQQSALSLQMAGLPIEYGEPEERDHTTFFVRDWFTRHLLQQG